MNKYELSSKYNDYKQFERLTKEEQAHLIEWIEKRVKPFETKRYNEHLRSYQMKHIYEAETGVYLTNGQFKGGMLSAGFEPFDYDSMDWRFKVGDRFVIDSLRLQQ